MAEIGYLLDLDVDPRHTEDCARVEAPHTVPTRLLTEGSRARRARGQLLPRSGASSGRHAFVHGTWTEPGMTYAIVGDSEMDTVASRRMARLRRAEDAALRPHGHECEHCRYASRRKIASLCFFSPEKKAAILRAAHEDAPPARWIGSDFCQIPSRAYFEWRRRHAPKKTYKGRVTLAMRRFIIDRDGYVCGICGDPVGPSEIDIDHILPASKGGSDDPVNLRVTHARCNRKRGNRLEEYP